MITIAHMSALVGRFPNATARRAEPAGLSWTAVDVTSFGDKAPHGADSCEYGCSKRCSKPGVRSQLSTRMFP